MQILRFKLLDLSSILLILTLNRHFSRAGIVVGRGTPISGVFGGVGGQTIGTPQTRRMGSIRGRFWGWGEAVLGKGPGRETQLRLPGHRGASPGQGNGRKLPPRPPEKKISVQKLTPSKVRRQKQPPSVTQEAAVSIRTRQPPIQRHGRSR